MQAFRIAILKGKNMVLIFEKTSTRAWALLMPEGRPVICMGVTYLRSFGFSDRQQGVHRRYQRGNGVCLMGIEYRGYGQRDRRNARSILACPCGMVLPMTIRRR